MDQSNYVCPKCGHAQFEKGEIRATGGLFTKILDIQNKHFTTITCDHCKYTEIYKTDSSTLGNIFDFLTN